VRWDERRQLKPDTCNLKPVFWDEVERGLGGRSRRSRGCAGDGESEMTEVVHEVIIAEMRLFAASS
jgi:hypothetical protein